MILLKEKSLRNILKFRFDKSLWNFKYPGTAITTSKNSYTLEQSHNGKRWLLFIFKTYLVFDFIKLKKIINYGLLIMDQVNLL